MLSLKTRLKQRNNNENKAKAYKRGLLGLYRPLPKLWPKKLVKKGQVKNNHRRILTI